MLDALSSSNLTAKTHTKSKIHIGARTQSQQQEEGVQPDQNQSDPATLNIRPGLQMEPDSDEICPSSPRLRSKPIISMLGHHHGVYKKQQGNIL